jgi:hypothetical protein
MIPDIALKIHQYILTINKTNHSSILPVLLSRWRWGICRCFIGCVWLLLLPIWFLWMTVHRWWRLRICTQRNLVSIVIVVTGLVHMRSLTLQCQFKWEVAQYIRNHPSMVCQGSIPSSKTTSSMPISTVSPV